MLSQGKKLFYPNVIISYTYNLFSYIATRAEEVVKIWRDSRSQLLTEDAIVTCYRWLAHKAHSAYIACYYYRDPKAFPYMENF